MSVCLKLDHPLPQSRIFLAWTVQNGAMSTVVSYVIWLRVTALLSDHHAYISVVMSSRLQLCCHVITLTILLSCHQAHNSIVMSSRTPRRNLAQFMKKVSLYWMCVNFFKLRAACHWQFCETVNSFGCVKWIHKYFAWCNNAADPLSFLWNWLFFQRTNVIQFMFHSESFFFV
jgi:hypothetical protein